MNLSKAFDFSVIRRPGNTSIMSAKQVSKSIPFDDSIKVALYISNSSLWPEHGADQPVLSSVSKKV
jgi:hypothetical protein